MEDPVFHSLFEKKKYNFIPYFMHLSTTCFIDENNELQALTKYRIIIIISFPGPDYLAKIRVKTYGINRHFFFPDVSLQSILLISIL